MELSTWRPPWLDTTIASTPRSKARRASSGCRIPLSTTGSRVRSRRVARWSQLSPRVGVDVEERLDRGPRLGERRLSRNVPGWLRVIDSSDRIAPRVTSTSCLIPAALAAGDALADQLAKPRVGGVLRDPESLRERQRAQVEVLRPPAQHGGVER